MAFLWGVPSACATHEQAGLEGDLACERMGFRDVTVKGCRRGVNVKSDMPLPLLPRRAVLMFCRDGSFGLGAKGKRWIGEAILGAAVSPRERRNACFVLWRNTSERETENEGCSTCLCRRRLFLVALVVSESACVGLCLFLPRAQPEAGGKLPCVRRVYLFRGVVSATPIHPPRLAFSPKPGVAKGFAS